MEQGQFCFITDEFYTAYDAEHKLMRNKETVDGKEHGRPCFYAFPDKKNPAIFWCVPISSKVDKYTGVYERKLEKQRNKGVKNPKCNTIRFGEVMGVKKAFLIQNMFPVVEKYIGEIYINKLTHEAVRIPQNIERDIMDNAFDVLRLVRGGNHFLVFSDVLKTYTDLYAELDKPDIEGKPGIVFESAEGIIFERSFTKKGLCRLDVRHKTDNKAIMTYKYKDAPGLSSPYISWENLNCCDGWVHDKTYLYTAVQRGKKLYSGFTLLMFDEEYTAQLNASRNDKLLTEKEAERLLEKLRGELPADCVMGSEGTDQVHLQARCRTRYFFICKSGAISDYINIDEVVHVYEQLGVEIDGGTREQINLLCDVPIQNHSDRKQGYDYANPINAAQLITTGLMLGYPLETTAFLIERDGLLPRKK